MWSRSSTRPITTHRLFSKVWKNKAARPAVASNPWKKRYSVEAACYKPAMHIPETFYTIDVLFGLFVLLFGVTGLLRGLADELSRLLAFVFLLGGFSFFYPYLTQQAALRWSALSPVAVQVAVGVVLWLSGMLFFFALRFLLKRLLSERIHKLTDKTAGALLGLLSGTLLGLSVLSVVSLVPDENLYRMLSEKSVVGGWVCNRMTPWLHPRLMELPVFDREEN